MLWLKALLIRFWRWGTRPLTNDEKRDNQLW